MSEKKKKIKVNKKSSFLTFKLGVFFRFSAIVEVANLLCTILFKAEKEWEGKRVIHSGLQSSPPLPHTSEFNCRNTMNISDSANCFTNWSWVFVRLNE